jgi:hypothetical protein
MSVCAVSKALERAEACTAAAAEAQQQVEQLREAAAAKNTELTVLQGMLTR